MTLSQYKKKVWKKMSLYIRLKYTNRWGNVRCYTCGTIKNYKKIHAGHFIHGNTKATYFMEKNVKPQCTSCNTFKGGMRDKYALMLIKEYGDGIIQEIHKVDKPNFVWTMEKLKVVERELDAKLKQYASSMYV